MWGTAASKKLFRWDDVVVLAGSVSDHEVLELIWQYKLGVGDHCTGTALMVLTGYRGPLGVATNRMLLAGDRGASTVRKYYGGVTQKVIRGRGVLEEEV